MDGEEGHTGAWGHGEALGHSDILGHGGHGEALWHGEALGTQRHTGAWGGHGEALGYRDTLGHGGAWRGTVAWRGTGDTDGQCSALVKANGKDQSSLDMAVLETQVISFSLCFFSLVNCVKHHLALNNTTT